MKIDELEQIIRNFVAQYYGVLIKQELGKDPVGCLTTSTTTDFKKALRHLAIDLNIKIEE